MSERMTEPTAPAAETERTSLLSVPSEGLASVAAVLGMLFIVGVAVDQAAWVGHLAGSRISQTAFLPVAMVLAGLVGLLLGRSRMGTLRSHVIGAAIGSAFLLYAASGAIAQVPGLEHRLAWLSWSVNAYAWESFVLGIRSSETSAFLLIVGALLWAVGQLGAFSVFRRRRPVPLIALGAGALLLNMTLTTQDQFVHLVLFAGAALVLIARLNLVAELDGWRIRRLSDPTQAGDLFFSRAAIFVGLAVVLSATLAGTASSAPLSRAWRDMDSRLLDVGYEVNRWLGGVSGPVRGTTNLFGPTQTLRDVWESSSEPLFTARVSDDGSYYWRGAVYDSFDGRTWQQLDGVAKGVAAGREVLADTSERMADVGSRRQLSVSVTSIALGGDVIVLPESPLAVDQATELSAHRGDGGFITLRLGEGLREGTQYGAISLVPEVSGNAAITAARLAAAGTDYEPWLDRYLEIRPGAVGRRAYAEANGIVSRLPVRQRNPYHIAEAIQNWFWRDGGFEYDTDLRGICVGENLVDCFLETKVGYCERYATAMTMMLRTQGIPSRYVVGYLPGQRQDDGSWQVDRSASHAWVEVYFPDYGWQRFDPTPGNTVNGQQPTQLEPGERLPAGPAASPTPPSASPGIDDEDDLIIPERGQFFPSPSASAGPPDEGPALPILLLIGLLLIVALLLAAQLLRRRQPMEVGRAYAGLTTLASRLGHPPRPSQTVYEYTSGLAQLVPAIEGDLRMLATAKVEATYARKGGSWNLGERLSSAYRRARVGLLRLIVRPPRWMRAPTQIRRRSHLP